LDFGQFFDRHCARGSLYTISSAYREQVSEYGVLELDLSSHLVGFREKPVYKYQVSMGVYMLSRRVLEHIPADRPFGFDQLMLSLIEKKKQVMVEKHQGHWLDIGRADDYVRAIEDFENVKEIFLR
jgi:NDP-sugar pyrophosphorylase family protein